jgi:uncharacterized membrane protein
MYTSTKVTHLKLCSAINAKIPILTKYVVKLTRKNVKMLLGIDAKVFTNTLFKLNNLIDLNLQHKEISENKE